MINLLPQTCTISRYSETLDAYKSPTSTLTIVGTGIKCRLCRDNRSKVIQDNPQPKTQTDYILYLLPVVSVKAGDIVEVEGMKLRAGEPYKPYGATTAHHIEIALTREEEV